MVDPSLHGRPVCFAYLPPGQVRFGPDVEWLPQEILPGLDVDEVPSKRNGVDPLPHMALCLESNPPSLGCNCHKWKG